MLQDVLSLFGFDAGTVAVTPFGSGLINHTWLVVEGSRQYILQRINHAVFQTPQAIDQNISRIGQYLHVHHPGYLFVQPLPATNGHTLLHNSEGWFRLLPFVAGSHTIDVVATPAQAYEAAAQFGRFTSVLRHFDADSLHNTIPHFHNLPLRYQQLGQAINNCNNERKTAAAALIQTLQAHEGIVAQFEQIVANRHFKRRVTHHDTKISNVLFDAADKGICVIDLDTVMPGYFISDVGDMLRTYLSPVSEEETDFSKIAVREDYFTAIAEGYLSHMGSELSAEEKGCFVYAGKAIIYMQALRFLTDYLNGDIYYGQKYEGHNLARAGNQTRLLELLIAKEHLLQGKVDAMSGKVVIV